MTTSPVWTVVAAKCQTFCDACQAIFKLDPKDAFGKDGSLTKIHHVSPHALFAASKRCRICKEVWIAGRVHLLTKARTQKAGDYRQLNPVYCVLREVEDIVETMPQDYDDFDPPQQKLKSSKSWLELSFRWTKNSWTEITSYHLLTETKASTLVGNHQPPTKVCSAPTWTLCKRWIQECAAHHAECKPTEAMSSFYPTRLLELYKIKNRVRARLLISKDEPPEGVYMTLSHCWGEAEVTKLTHATLNRFKASLNISQLPRLYQDAITITLSLGVHYLWIDSLCIIQDEPQKPSSDWMNESKLMGSVYGHSFCNIAASEAADSHGSLFHDRNTSIIKPSKVMMAQDSVSPSSFYLYPAGLCKIDPDEPLAKRGWVLQEQLIPPRTLIFTKQQIHWECRSKEACESFPGGKPPVFSGRQLLQTTLPNRPTSELKNWLANESPVYFFCSKDSSFRSPWESFWLTWKCIVEDYSARYITKSGDKLTAISGLASLLIQKMEEPSIYMAGMWNSSSTIIYELGWTVGKHTNGEPASRPKVYRAPTWSWASMDGAISYRYKRDYYMTGDANLAYVKDMQVVTVDGSTAGPIKSGFMDIHGPLTLVDSDWPLTGPEDNLDCSSGKLYRLSMVNIYTDQTIWGLELRCIETGPDQGCYRRVGFFRSVSDLYDMSRYDELYKSPKTTIRIV